MITAIIIGAIIQLFTLIVFFIMASNISKIKKHLLRMVDDGGYMYFNMAKEELYVGDKEKSKDLLLRAKYQYKNSPDGVLYLWGDQWRDKSDIVAEIDGLLAEL